MLGRGGWTPWRNPAKNGVADNRDVGHGPTRRVAGTDRRLSSRCGTGGGGDGDRAQSRRPVAAAQSVFAPPCCTISIRNATPRRAWKSPPIRRSSLPCARWPAVPPSRIMPGRCSILPADCPMNSASCWSGRRCAPAGRSPEAMSSPAGPSVMPRSWCEPRPFRAGNRPVPDRCRD